MTFSSFSKRASILAGAAAAMAFAATIGAAQAGAGKAESFTAQAVNPNSMNAVARSTRVDITIERWSTDAEEKQLTAALREKGPEQLLTTLQALPRVGRIGASGGAGYDIHFAHRLQSGQSERVRLLTDRPLGFWESAGQDRSVNYPFTLVELRVGPDGKGEGKVSLATKVAIDKDTGSIALENYEQQPVTLMGVQRVDH